MASRIPVEVVFSPNWWFRNYGIRFDEPFYFDRDRRIADDVAMRRALHQRFGLGVRDPQPRPIVGSQQVAGGFVIPALLGVEIRFAPDQSPWPVPADLSRERILALRVPEIETTWPMNRWIADMDALEKEFGSVVGDFDPDGILNTALQLRGQQFFVDLLEDPELTDHLCGIILETQARVAGYVRSRTGTCGVSTNRSILNVDPRLYVESNCSMQMISPLLYERALERHERTLADRLRPFGIHHCGNNLHLFAARYARTGAVFYDVGWGSEIARCSRTLPDAFLNLRLSPVRMLQESAATIREDIRRALEQAGRTEKVGLCCINMDYGTPDANVEALLSAVLS